MATLKFKFAVIDAPDDSFIKGVALLDPATGKRIGQIVALPVTDADVASAVEAVDMRCSSLPADMKMVGD